MLSQPVDSLACLAFSLNPVPGAGPPPALRLPLFHTLPLLISQLHTLHQMIYLFVRQSDFTVIKQVFKVIIKPFLLGFPGFLRLLDSLFLALLRLKLIHWPSP